jgi:hypothetical protein
MGIDTETWRGRIGCFSGHSARDKFIVPAILVRGPLVRATLPIAVLVFTLLVVAGDVERHPGPPKGAKAKSSDRVAESVGNQSQTMLNFNVRDLRDRGDNSNELTLQDVMRTLQRMETNFNTTTDNIRDEIASVNVKVDECLSINQQV